jgi:hypothetical protein
VPLIMGQFMVSGTSPTAYISIPTGSYSMVMYTTAATTVFMGTGTALTSTNGFALHTVPTAWTGFQGEAGSSLYAIATTGTVPVNYILSYQM